MVTVNNNRAYRIETEYEVYKNVHTHTHTFIIGI